MVLIGEYKDRDNRIFKTTSKNTIEVNFDEIFKREDLKKLNIFVMKSKRSFANKSKLYCRYLNYFIKHYDEDNELLMAYLEIKFNIDHKNKYSKKTFINDLYEYLLSPTMVEKVGRMTEDNYITNIDNQPARYNESLQFTNEHGKILMNMSFAMKMFIPLLTHYAYVYNIKTIEKFILKCFDGIAEHFEGDNDMYNKVYETVTSRINSIRSSDKLHWLRVEIEGDDPLNQVDNIVNKIYIGIMHKYVYSKNIIHLNHAAIRKSMKFIRKTKSKLNYNPVTNKKDADGLSDFDKIEINNAKFDESIVIMGDINVRQSVSKLLKKYNVDIDEEELMYYQENLQLKPWQRDLIFQLFSKYFGSTKDLYDVKLPNICKLIIVMKRMLYAKGFEFMQHILTGNVVETINRRGVSKKQTNKIAMSPIYKEFQDKYKDTIDILILGNVFANNLNTILNSKITLVDYDLKEYQGKLLKLENEDVISHELLRFIGLI